MNNIMINDLPKNLELDPEALTTVMGGKRTVITGALKNGCGCNFVSLVGFGTFSVKKRTIHKDYKKHSFRAGKSLKDVVS